MMGSCEGLSSCLHRSRYISWCVDSAESPTPETTPLTAAEESSQRNNQQAGSGPVPLLLLSPPETSGGEPNAALPHQRSQPTKTKRTHQRSCCSRSKPRTNNASKCHAEDDGDDGGGRGNKEDSSLLHPGSRSFLLPRSSPVISRRHMPISWHGVCTDTSDPSSSYSRSPASGSLSLDWCGYPADTGAQDVGPKPDPCQQPSPWADKKPRCVSTSTHPNWLQLPFSGQQGHGSDAPHSSGVSTSTQPSKERGSGDIWKFSADIFKSSCELEKENAHFVVVDMVLEVLEAAKWSLNHEGQTHCNTCTDRQKSAAEDKHRHTQSCSSGDPAQDNTETSNGNTHTHRRKQDEEEADHLPKTFSVLSSDSGFEDYVVDTTLTPTYFLTNAECLAQQLVLDFRRSWLPSHEPRRGRKSLRSCLQELPGTGGVAVSSESLAEKIRLRTRMRGSLSWAPPRFQIIFTAQPTHRRSEVVALQHFLCAGCGTAVEPRYIKKLRYCEYLGRYFCDCCHGGSEAVIPGRLLSCWDFGRYPVSDFSKQLLESVWQQPLFDLTCVGKTLYSRVKELQKFRELQDQLMGIKKLLTACRLSGRVMAEFEQLPAHLTEQPHLFSMEDLLRVKKGQLMAQARALLHSAIEHVENCELCLARGFICEFCRERDIIFPFQSDTCKRCPVCRACFHKRCFVEKKCPKCARIQSRKKRPDGSVK
ncbi:protein associated with UVRAG as autophagy enhancer isoform X1 [Etheostoma cragini]|uniref:protein associated with UVRAG as autophagy enhancer isoform X1 n=1 Tax=Etheostoma cragini TaxID=417921 RepID=UPI00155E7B7A|nr:protein associated with UVRAG as autophagy enhancer isoform X1 [Etheostoma cragini]